ncbi:MAG: MFS transporter [Negativicutes bacterium]|nr:MFS transporter [Negativicutes bacterium]
MTDQNLTAQNPTRQRFIILAVLLIGIMVAYLDRVNVSVLAANEIFLNDMGIKGQPIQIGMMMSTFLIAYGVANLTLSPLGDYFGPRKAMLASVVLWCVALSVGGIAGSFAVLIASRIILGIGEGFYYPMQGLLVKNWFPGQERGRANAAWIIGQSLGPALAMPIFAYVIVTFGWRESFHAATFLTLIPLYLLWFHTADTPREHKKVNALELQHIESGLDQSKATVKETLLQRIKPFISNYRYWLLVYWYVSLNFMFWGFVSWLPSYLKSARGFSWGEMGWMASLPFILAIVSKAVTGWAIDRTGRSAPFLFAAMFFGGLGVYWAAVVPGKYEAAILLALAFAVCNMAAPAAWTLLQGLVPTKSLSTAGGIMNGVTAILSSISPVLIGFVISMTGNYANGLFLLVGAGMLAAGVAAILVVQKY